MSQSILNTLEVEEYIADVHHAFQEQGNRFMDPNVCRLRRITGGKSAHFPKKGKLRATQRVVGTPIVTSNASAADVEIAVTEYTVACYTDIFLQSEVNFDEKQEDVMEMSLACGRKVDQVAINALAAGTYVASVNQVATNISGSADGMRFAAVVEAAKQMDRVTNMQKNNRSLVAYTDDLHHMVAADQAAVASSDYVNNRTNENGIGNNLYRFNFIPVGDMDDEDGLPLNTGTDVRSNYAFLRPALGLVVNMEPMIRVDWVAEMGSYLAAAYLSVGSKIIDNTGIVEILTDQSP